jgi:hypothetical protein
MSRLSTIIHAVNLADVGTMSSNQSIRGILTQLITDPA